MSKERRCEQYQCGKPHYYSLPEFGDLCEECYLKMYEYVLYSDNIVKTIYIEGE